VDPVILRLFLAPALVAGLFAAPANAADDAKAIIQKAIDAHGGADKLNKVEAARIKSKGTISIQGMDIELTSEAVYRMPDKIRTDLDLNVMDQKLHITQVIAGDKVTIVSPQGKMQLEGPQLEEGKMGVYMLSVFRLTPLLDDKSFTLKALGDRTANGQELVGVQVSSKGRKDVKLFFDKKTGMLARVERTGLEPGGTNEVPREEMFSNYKDFDGIKRHTKTLVNVNGAKLLDTEISEYKTLDKVDEKTFELSD
jgi:hypothetical protein